jgi:hypothetical protein
MATAELLDHNDELTEVSYSSLEQLNRSEIDVQISTAKRYPRSIKAFKQQAMEMATLDEDTAASMFYVLPRGGKKIEGPSVRMAEVVGSCYGNLRYGARIVSVDDKFVTAQGACHDLEKNIAINYESKRRITDKHGKRYNDDMIQTTGNAAASIALREAIFRVVPRSLFKAIYEEAKLTSVGKATSMNEKRHKAVDWFRKAGATDAQLFTFLGRAGIDEITIDDLITLRGLVTAIKDGETTIEDALAVRESTASKVHASPLNQPPSSKGKNPAAEKSNSEVHAEEAVATEQPQAETKPDRWADVRAAFDECSTLEEVADRQHEFTTNCASDADANKIREVAEMARARLAPPKSGKGAKQRQLMETTDNVPA